MADVVWPKGYAAFYSKVAEHKDKILGGTLLAIDPSSGSGKSMPGFAVFEAGILVNCGTIAFPKKKAPVYDRLQHLTEQVAKILPTPPDVLVIEEIHKNIAHLYLLWSVGVSIAAAKSPVTFELPINCWKALAKVSDDYHKTDAEDAVIIGRTLIELAKRDK